MHKNLPKISIAMTTYNGESFLKEQIESILKQTYQSFELIICDDKSSDSTFEILQQYSHKYTKIKVYQNKQQLGVVKNFEKVINLSTSPYIALSDQDDIWNPQKLEILLKEIKQLESQYPKLPCMVHSDLSLINETKQLLHPSFFTFKHYKLKEEKDLTHILGPCGVMGNTLLMNQLLKDKILPFPSSTKVHDYWIALINEIFGKRKTILQPLVQYRIHQNNVSNSKSKLYLLKYKKIISLFKQLPFMNIKRDKLLHYLLEHYPINTQDKKIIQLFLLYLEKKGNPFLIYFYLIKFNFLKKNIPYRILIAIKILLFWRKERNN